MKILQVLLAAVLFVCSMSVKSNDSSYVNYGPPYYHNWTEPPHETAQDAIDHWWRLWKEEWPNNNCVYTLELLEPYPYNNYVNVAYMHIQPPCGGDGWVAAENYSYRPERNLGPGSCDSKVQCGNPINTAIGNKYQSESDVEAIGLLSFNRYYNSHAAAYSHTLGPKWTDTYSRKIEYLTSPGIERAVIFRPEGDRLNFTMSDGVWQSEVDVASKLEQITDDSGVFAGWVFSSADAPEQEFYDNRGRLTEIVRTDGQFIALIYNNGQTQNDDRDFLPTSVTDQSGRALTLEYDELNLRLMKITDSSGAQIEYGYDAIGRLATVLYPEAIQPRRYHYNEAAYTDNTDQPYALTGITHEDGQRYAIFKYAADGKAVSTEHAGGTDKFSVVYEADGTSTVALPHGSSQSRAFSTPHGVRKTTSSIESCAGCATRTTTYTFDSFGRYDVNTDAQGVTTDHDYDARGLETQRIEAANDATGAKRTIQTDWHPDFRVPSERRIYDADDVLEAKTTWTHNARGQALTQVQTDPVSGAIRTTTTTYCEQTDIDAGSCPLLGLVTSVDGPRTDVSDLTSFTYRMADEVTCATAPTTCPHRKGDLWKVTNALGHVTETLRYDGAGRVLSVKAPTGVVTDMEYHPRGWLTARKVRGANDNSETDDAITGIEYWPTGLVKQVTQPDGAFTAYIYDDAHRLTDIADNEGNTIHYTLDNAGNRTGEDTKDAQGTLFRTLSRVYNQLGQLQTQQDAYDHATGFTYDANGNTDTVTDALTRVTDNDYDPLNRLRRTLQDIDGIAAETKFEYDALDNLTKVTDPKGLDTDYTYNGLGDLLQLDSPDTGTTTYTYDSAGNRQTQTDARGITTTYSYDALNRLTTIIYSDGSTGTTYKYDSDSNCDPHTKGRLAKMVDASGTTLYCYDRFGNLIKKQQNGNRKFTVQYTYTLVGQLSSIIYPDGLTVDYVRDDQGRTTEVGVTSAGGSRQVLLTEATYYPFGPAAEWVYGNGRLMRRGHNLNYQPGFIEVPSAGGISLGYEFDAVGNLKKLRGADQSDPPDRTYNYDGLNRLTDTFDGVSGALLQGYTYDATGNRMSATVSGITTPYTYPTLNHRLTQVGGTARTYDNAGNTKTIGGTSKTFTYNAANRMSRVTAGILGPTNYAYNGKGEQVRKYHGTNNTYTVYDESGHWLGDYDTSGAPIQRAIWLDDLPVGLIVGTNNQLHYIEPDHLGTPRVVVDPVRDVAVWNWPLMGEAFGDTPPNQDPDGDGTQFVFDMRMPGQRWDSASGLNQNYFRDYESATGRYVESDPIGLLADVSTYSYSLGSPLIYSDRFGLDVDNDYMMCLYEQRQTGIPQGCGRKLVQSAVAGLKKETIRECRVVGESVVCTAICTVNNFIFDPRHPIQSIFERHGDVAIHALKKAAIDIASKNLARAAGMMGAVMTIKDTVGTITCTTKCVKK